MKCMDGFTLHGSGDPVQIFFLFSQVAQTGMVIECVSRKKAHEFGYCQMGIRPPSHEINQVRTGYLPPRSSSRQTSRIFPDIPSCTSLKMQIAAAYTQSLLLPLKMQLLGRCSSQIGPQHNLKSEQ